MPIYPREAASPGVPTQNTPMAPLSPQGRQVQQFGEQAVDTSLRLEDVRRKREEFRDDTLVNQRLMDASEQMAEMEIELQKPENALRAKEYFDQELQDRRPKWMEGLSPRAQLKLEQRLLPRQLEFKIGAAKMEHRAMADMRDGEFVRMSNNFADRFSRDVVSFDKDGAVVYGGDQDGKDTREWQMMEQYLDEDARMGYRKIGDVEKIKEAELGKASFYRANKLTQSDSVADLTQYTKLYRAEMQAPGSTYLKRLDPDKRDALNNRAHTRILEIREKQEVQEKKILTQDSNVFVSNVLRSYADPDIAKRMKPEEFETGLSRYSPIMPRETVDALLKLREAPRLEGGVSDPDAYNRIMVDVLSGEKVVTQHDIVRYIGEGPGKISAKDAMRILKENDTTQAEHAVEKTRYYKEGNTHLKVLVGGVLVPGFEWAMRPAEAKKYSDALFLYNKHARQVYQTGNAADLAALPEFARALGMKMRGGKQEGSGTTGDGGGSGSTPTTPKPGRTGSKPGYAPPGG
jgi:hypothetical protein